MPQLFGNNAPPVGIHRAAVVIGVDRPGSLPPLRAASSGALKFAKWAMAQGMDTVTLTDAEKKHVALGDVYNAVNGLLNPPRYDQLIIYFAGHGFLLAQETEIWMLSGAPANANEAVNLARSRSLSLKCGIPNVVFISDACRTFASNDEFHHVEGGAIFPNQGTYKDDQEIDLFYASSVGDPSYEAKMRQEGKEPVHNGVFTDVLLRGLNDEGKKLAKWYDDPVGRFVVRQRDLKTYLRNEVPKAIAALDPSKDQRPDIQVLSDFPHFMAVVGGPPSPVKERPPFKDVLSFDIDEPRETSDGPDLPPGTIEGPDQTTELYRPSDLAKLRGTSEGLANIAQVERAEPRTHFETRTGFSVSGAQPLSAISDLGRCEIFNEGNAWHIRVEPNDQFASNEGGSVVIVFEGGSVTVLAVLMGFIGAVAVDQGRVVNVSYTPSQNSNLWVDYVHVAKELAERRAVVGALARQGMFRVERGSAARNVKYIRAMKTLDPTLGLYAAYAYQQIGDMKGVESVFEYMSQERVPVPFDVAMIAERIEVRALAYAGVDQAHDPLPNKLQVAPFCPMLTQGWALMDLNEMPRSDLLKEMRQHLLPGLWLTLNQAGMNPIIEQLESEWT